MRLMALLGIVLILSLAGCATARRDTVDIRTQQFENRIRQLEREAQQKDRKISELEYELNTAHMGKVKVVETKVYPDKKVLAEKKADISNKNIQRALKKAGFYNGAIDGKIGKNTKNAIKRFQEANGLNADGIVGKKTWEKLNRYLN